MNMLAVYSSWFASNFCWMSNVVLFYIVNEHNINSIGSIYFSMSPIDLEIIV